MNDFLTYWKKQFENSIADYALFDVNFKLLWSKTDQISEDINSGFVTAYDKYGIECELTGESEKYCLITKGRKIIPAQLSPLYDYATREIRGYALKILHPYEFLGGEFISKENSASIRQNISGIVANSSALAAALEVQELYSEYGYVNNALKNCVKLLSGITNSEVLNSMFNDAERNQPLNASTHLESVIEMAKFNFGDNLEITTEIQSDVILDLDSEQFLSAVMNLIVNGYTYNISEEKQIDVSLRSDGETAFITIDDNGIGIDSRKSDRLFIKKSEGNFESEGLGLTVVKLFAKIHGGSVKIISKGENVGTTVRISLPVCKNAESFTECRVSEYNLDRFSTFRLLLAKAKIPE